MDQIERKLEAIAEDVVRKSKMEPPIDGFALCLLAGLQVYEGLPGTRPTVVQSTVLVAPEDPGERQRFAAAHELAHLILRERGLPDTEWNANWLASALILPRRWFMGRLVERGWDLEALRSECKIVSYEAIARRIVNLGRAVLWVCDRGPAGRAQYRVRSRGVGEAYATPLPRERALVAAAARSLAPATDGARIGAWPIYNAHKDHLRVVSLLSPDLLAA